MSLTGVRDISVIETPPEERYPIQTYVVEQNDQLIRDAILREVGRDGQVYFVYNRVESIQSVANYIRELVPECKVGIIHGKMTEKELETEMINFMQKEYDVLVCTTIIETGIDIPNVNTMIVNNSDKMGLSQLYQLRGRVGRSNKIAYAYFMYTKDKVLTEVAVKLIKGEIDQEPIETTVDIKMDAYIPSSYIEDEIQKIEVYKKIAAIENMNDYNEIKEELKDRYSTIPEVVYSLMDIAYIKSLAKILLIEEIKENQKEIRFKFSKGFKNINEVYSVLLNKYKDNVVLYFGETPFFAVRINTIKREEMLNFYKTILKELIENSLKK